MKHYTNPQQLINDISKTFHLSQWGQISLLAFQHHVLEDSFHRFLKNPSKVQGKPRIERYRFFVGICRGVSTDLGIDPDYDLVSRTEQEQDKPFKASPVIEPDPTAPLDPQAINQLPPEAKERLGAIIDGVNSLSQVQDVISLGQLNPDIDQSKRDLEMYKQETREQYKRALKEIEGRPALQFDAETTAYKSKKPLFLFVGRFEHGNKRTVPGNLGQEHKTSVGLFDQDRVLWYMDTEMDIMARIFLTTHPKFAAPSNDPKISAYAKYFATNASKAIQASVAHALSEDDILYYLSISPIYLRGKITDLHFGLEGQLPHEKKQSLPR
jgi:hypothetical protein